MLQPSRCKTRSCNQALCPCKVLCSDKRNYDNMLKSWVDRLGRVSWRSFLGGKMLNHFQKNHVFSKRCCLRGAQQSLCMPTVPPEVASEFEQETSAILGRKPRDVLESTSEEPPRAKPSQLSKSSKIYSEVDQQSLRTDSAIDFWRFDWRIRWWILRWVFFLEWRVLRWIFAADHSHGFPDLSLSPQKNHKIPFLHGALLQDCEGQVWHPKQSMGQCQVQR